MSARQETEQKKKYEEHRALDGTVYKKNLDTNKDYTWIYQVQKGRYRASLMRKRTVRELPAGKAESGHFAEQVLEKHYLVLEQGVKDLSSGEWRNVRMWMPILDGRVLQFVFDGLEDVPRVFKDRPIIEDVLQ